MYTSQTWVKYIIALDSNVFTLLSMSSVLIPMIYFEKVQTPPSGPLGWFNCTRQDQSNQKVFESKTITYFTQV